jgi:hypothetical protein
MPIVAPFLPYESLRKVATDFLTTFHPTGELPVPIEEIVEFGLNLDIVPVPGLQNDFEVDAYLTSDLAEIRVDRFTQEKRPNRYRFSLAHEVGHLLIHKDVFSQLTFSTITEWKSTIASIPEDQYGWIEWQAYCLAGLILVPRDALAPLLEDQLAKAKAAGINVRRMERDARKFIEDYLGRNHFHVSREVIAKRIAKDSLWN